ncbi:MAG: aminoglycoside phosphotransferase family protein [Candidatus Levybacteria bacterium]|nr:aminoglycoside phosphotransferase family protein [Candidatus Levybacteria bacterium]
MKKSSDLFNSKHYERFLANQKQTYLEKADIPLPTLRNLKSVEPKIHEIKKILTSHEIGTLHISKIHPSSLHSVYKIIDNKKTYILRLNLLTKRREFQFYLDSLIPGISNNSQVMYHVDISRKIVPYDFEIIEVLPGHTLYEPTKNKTLQLSTLEKAGEKLFTLHEIKGKGFGYIDVKSFIQTKKIIGIKKGWDEHIFTNFEKHLQYCLENKLISEGQAKKLEKVFAGKKGFLKHMKYSSLLHGDVSHPNMYLSGKNLLYIDFDDALMGDPYYDVAFYATGTFGNEEWLTAFLKGYTKLEKLSKDFEERFWLYYLRTSLVKTLVRHKFGKKNKVITGNFSGRLEYALAKF